MEGWIVGVVFLLGFPLLFFITLVLLLKARKMLKLQTKLTKGVTDADAYFLEQKQEADAYLLEQKQEADAYLLEQKQGAEKLVEDAKRAADNLDQKSRVISQTIETLKADRSLLEMEVKKLELNVLIGSVNIEDYENLRSDEIKNQLSMLQSRQNQLVKDNMAVEVTMTNRNKKETSNQVKQILRSFNAECAVCLDGITVKNVDSTRAKIQRSFNTLNTIFETDGVSITGEYLAMKFEELSLRYAYMVKEEEEKEQRRAIREQMMEEEKVRREIEREKQKIEKETAQFQNEVNKLMSYMQKSKDDVERQLYIDKIHELEERLKGLEKDKENALQREQNTRAGFVYIISNIGSFGENIYKIGMTRRLNPMDRISELSSASVPFSFDVHAMIFSDDAPALETILHQTFHDNQVNKVNPRKEFYRINLEEIKKIVKERHNATVHFIDEADATEYRETLRLEGENG